MNLSTNPSRILLHTLIMLTIMITLCLSARPGPDTAPEATKDDYGEGGYGGAPPGFGSGPGGYMGGGEGYYYPGAPPGGGGYGWGYGGSGGGGRSSEGGRIARPSVVCREKGACYMKKLKCPARCFHSFHRSGKGYGYGGGGGGCTLDCTKCVADC